MLALAKRYGYDGIEPRVQAGHGHGLDLDVDAATRREAAQKAQESGVDLCCIATSCRYSDPDTVQQNVEDTQRAIDLAADVGSTRIRVFGGKIGGGLSREAAIDQVAASLSAVADHAQARGVTVCMETHDDWTRSLARRGRDDAGQSPGDRRQLGRDAPGARGRMDGGSVV